MQGEFQMTNLRQRPIRFGFTLIELLVVSAIVGVLMAVIAACLAGGIRVWDRSQSFAVIESEAAIGLRILEKDLMNTFPFYGIRFNGEPTSLSFPSLILGEQERRQSDDISEFGERIGTVKYWFDSQKQTLFRQTWTYPRNDTSTGNAEALLSHLGNVSLQYYASARERQGGSWQQGWDDETNFPSRVRIQLSFIRDSETMNMVRTVLLPTERVQNSRKK
jgi:prepilin-type N-terminal cleavage/methylation domain-containing protein